MEGDAQVVSDCAFLPREAYEIRVASGALQFSPNVEGLATVKGRVSYWKDGESCSLAPEAPSWRVCGPRLWGQKSESKNSG